MSRHRDIRNMKRADYDYSDDDSYGSYGSYGSYDNMSPSTAQFIYRRDGGQTAGDDKYYEDSALEKCIDEVGDVLGYEGWTREEFCEAIEKCNYDSEKATAMLLEQKAQWEKGNKEAGDGVFEIEFEEAADTKPGQNNQGKGNQGGNKGNQGKGNQGKGNQGGQKGNQATAKGGQPQQSQPQTTTPQPPKSTTSSFARSSSRFGQPAAPPQDKDGGDGASLQRQAHPASRFSGAPTKATTTATTTPTPTKATTPTTTAGGRAAHPASRFSGFARAQAAEEDEDEEEGEEEAQPTQTQARQPHPASRFGSGFAATGKKEEEGDHDDEGSSDDEEGGHQSASSWFRSRQAGPPASTSSASSAAKQPPIARGGFATTATTSAAAATTVTSTTTPTTTTPATTTTAATKGGRPAHPASRFANRPSGFAARNVGGDDDDDDDDEEEANKGGSGFQRKPHPASRFFSTPQQQPQQQQQQPQQPQQQPARKEQAAPTKAFQPSPLAQLLDPAYPSFSFPPSFFASLMSSSSSPPSSSLPSAAIPTSSTILFSPSYAATADIVPFAFDEPSPDDVVLEKRKQAFIQKKSGQTAKPKPSPKPAANTAKPKPAPATPKQGNRPGVLVIEATGPTPPSTPKGKGKAGATKEEREKEKESAEGGEGKSEENQPRKKVQQNTPSHRKELTKRMADAAAKNTKKEHLNMVVIGHVDAGKSTIMGHLLYLLGEVSSKTMHRYQKDSKDIGKSSFSFAWVLDEHAEERARGITMDVGVTHLQTEHKRITLLDAPGHRDFVPNMISGTAQADVSVLVINSLHGEFEAGFNQDGQTKEHALLARSLGITQMIVAVNKMDGVDWAQGRFLEIQEKLTAFFKQVSLNAKNVTFIPISGLTGENLNERKESKLSWYTGPTLVQAIDSFKPATRLVDQPFRLCISDVYKNVALGNAVGGKVEAGVVSVSDKLIIMPLGEICTVKSLMSHGEYLEWATAGENVDLGLSGPELNAFHVGDVLCDPERPIPVVKRFRAQVLVFALQIPITKGYQVMLHAQSLQEPAFMTKLVSIIDPTTGHTKRKRPRCLNEKNSAVVEITTQHPICMELYRDYKQLGRFMLRVQGRTIAAGIVTEFLE